MKKKIVIVSILFIILLFVTVFSRHKNPKQNKEEKTFTTDISIEETTTKQDEIQSETEIQTEKETEKQTEPPTIPITYPDLYVDFTKEEIYMIQRCVETETHGTDIKSKMNVASVIFNRLNHPDNKYGDDIIAIITAPHQFAYWRTDIEDTTIEAIENVYKYGDTTNGCMAFRSDIHPKKWYSWELQFVDSAGHGFYR